MVKKITLLPFKHDVVDTHETTYFTFIEYARAFSYDLDAIEILLFSTSHELLLTIGLSNIV